MIRVPFSILLSFALVSAHGVVAQQSAAAPSGRAIGTVAAINGNIITVKADSGTEIKIAVQDSTRMVKTLPGQKDLTGATPIHLQDIQIGDRALVRGASGEGSNSLTATSIIIMKQSDVASHQQEEMQDWQRRGVGGIVRSVDAASGIINVATNQSQIVAVETSPKTQFLRYAPDSVKFSDAKKSSISEIKAGDQLRARGSRSSDGQQLTAEAVISGSFRNIAGTVNSVDPGAGTLTVMDVISRRAATVKITADTQMRKIPPEIAQRIAMFLRRPRGESGSSPASGPPGGGPGGGMMHAGGAPGGPPDFQQMIRRMPPATISDLQKGDAVMIVTTEGAPGEQVTALTLLSGVEPILTAAPSQTTAANLLSGWSMSGGGEGESQ